MNRLTTEQRVSVVAALVEGNSVNSTVRMTGVSKPTILNLLVDLGTKCAEYQDEHLRNLNCRRIECDETWSFVHAKQKNVPAGVKGQFGFGDVWTWVALDADSKLVACWLVGLRDGGYATEFIRDLTSRLSNRVQLTTDGLRAYLEAVEDGFGGEIDYAQLHKIYGPEFVGEARYSPPRCIGCERKAVVGNPVPELVSTSYVEPQNLTMRMGMRRFTRLTNGFSKKLENHCAMIALHFMYYNFARIHKTLRCTPAMRAKVSEHVWSIEEIVALLD
jgi:IS1 family transposase